MSEPDPTELHDVAGDFAGDVDGEGSPTLVARNVHVVYRSHNERPSRLARKAAPDAGRRTEVHAVKGVSLVLHEGESIGIIGSNGSGKSSLVTARSGLIVLADGVVRATSRPAVLGGGAARTKRGSGRRNLLLGLLALGLTRDEINKRMRSIIKFSGLADSNDRPMKTYSSGMRARLAFTIATEVAPDILIIDEALSVGDRRFRARAAQRIEDIREAAGSIIVISHNLSEVASMCTRVIWLEDGQVVADGDADEVLPAYEAANPSPKKAEKRTRRQAMRRRIRQAERERALEWAKEQIDADGGGVP